MPNAMITAPPVRHADPDAVGLGHFAAQSARRCPYLAPSLNAHQTWWTQLPAPAPADEDEQVVAALFAAGLTAGERVRARAAVGDRLACEVVSAIWPVSPARRDAGLAWPHWALKLLFGPVGVLVGKFVPDQPGDRVVLAARACVPARDRRLLTRTPRLACTAVTAVDDGRSVLAAVPGAAVGAGPPELWPPVRAWAATLTDLPEPSGREADGVRSPAGRPCVRGTGELPGTTDRAGGRAEVPGAS